MVPLMICRLNHDHTVEFDCPFCKIPHKHTIGTLLSGDVNTRVAECTSPDSPFLRTGIALRLRLEDLPQDVQREIAEEAWKRQEERLREQSLDTLVDTAPATVANLLTTETRKTLRSMDEIARMTREQAKAELEARRRDDPTLYAIVDKAIDAYAAVMLRCKATDTYITPEAAASLTQIVHMEQSRPRIIVETSVQGTTSDEVPDASAPRN